MAQSRVVFEIFNVEKSCDLEIPVKSLKVVGTDTYRSVTYDFLLTFHSNHGPISYRFRDKRRFRSKIAKFSTPPMYFAPMLKGFPCNWVSALGVKKTKMIGLSGRERSLTISSAVWIQYTNVTDRQTDRHRTTAKTALTHSVARYNTSLAEVTSTT